MKTIKQNFTVDGVEFMHWFNNTFLPSYEYHFRNTYAKGMPANKIWDANAFRTVMALINKVSGKTDTPLNEFIAYFCLFYNETGATFRPITEMGEDWYFFEKGTGVTMRSRYGVQLAWKASYNGTLGNDFAGRQLLAKGIITNKQATIWNSQEAYPHTQPDNVKAEARNCDFYRFRGRGLIQTTGKDNYRLTVEPLLAGKTIDEMSNTDLDKAFQDPIVYMGAVRNFYLSMPARTLAVRRAAKGEFHDMAWVTAGNNPGYISEYITRTSALTTALSKATLADMPEIDYQLFQLKRPQVIELQKALALLDTKFYTRMTSANGFDGIAGPATIQCLIESGKTVQMLLAKK